MVFALSFNPIEFIQDLGISLMIVGFIFYSLMPFSVYMGKVMFEKSAESMNETLEKDFDRLKDEMSDIGSFILKNLGISRVKEIFSNRGSGFSEGLNILLHSLVGYLGNLMIMFFTYIVVFLWGNIFSS